MFFQANLANPDALSEQGWNKMLTGGPSGPWKFSSCKGFGEGLVEALTRRQGESRRSPLTVFLTRLPKGFPMAMWQVFSRCFTHQGLNNR
jgi:hypothetical protein